MSKINKSVIFIFSILILLSCNIQRQVANDSNTVQQNDIRFDEIKASKYGADSFGMKKYVIAFLKRGPNREKDPEKAKELQKAHMNNINRMAKEGKLVLAGPFLDDGEIRGIYIFDVATIDEAKKLTETDPAIIAGSLIMELKTWYGSAALMEINQIHETLTKNNFE